LPERRDFKPGAFLCFKANIYSEMERQHHNCRQQSESRTRGDDFYNHYSTAKCALILDEFSDAVT
jgi:hypothetical protein